MFGKNKTDLRKNILLQKHFLRKNYSYKRKGKNLTRNDSTVSLGNKAHLYHKYLN